MLPALVVTALGGFLAGVVGLILAVPGSAQTMPMPVDIQLPLFLKILTYDRSFQFNSMLTIAISGQSTSLCRKSKMPSDWDGVSSIHRDRASLLPARDVGRP